MTDAAFHGVFPYLVSPVSLSGEIMGDVLERLCNDLIAAGVHGLTPLGSTGEFDRCRRGDWDAAMDLQRRLWRINQVFAKYNLAACIKGGLELQGYAVGAPLAPQPPLSPEGIGEVRLALSALCAL